jgi:hypothetical protein
MNCAPFLTVDAWTLHIQQPDAADYCLVFDAPFAGRIASLSVKAGLGSGQCSVKIDDEPVAGIDNVAFGTEKREFVAQDDNAFAPGDQIIFSMLGGVNVADLRATVKYLR